MILYPAIDLKDGACVRLLRGDMDKATVFSQTPADQAAQFEADGFSWLHIVDLNGAFAGKPVNGAAVKSILSTVKMQVQLGGGIRTLEMIDTWLTAGVAAIIYTDISRDGAMQGANVEETVSLAKAITTPVIASGGVSSIDDIIAYKAVETSGISGIIIGRALYDGAIKASAALAAVR